MVKKKATKRGKTSVRGRKTASRRSAKRSKSGSRKSARKTARRSARKPAAKKATARKTSARKAPKRSSPAKTPAPRKAAGSAPSGEMYGEGAWKADQEYRQGIKEFSRTRDSGELAREAAEDIEEDEGPRKPGKPQAEGEDDSEW